jgi:hypothetical protein
MTFTLRREGLIECKRTKSTEARQQSKEQSGKIAPTFKNDNGIGKDYLMTQKTRIDNSTV